MKIIEAEVWRPGLEDGWGSVGSLGQLLEVYSNDDVDLGLAQEEDTLLPLILVDGFWAVVERDQLIVTENGERRLEHRETFYLHHERLPDDC